MQREQILSSKMSTILLWFENAKIANSPIISIANVEWMTYLRWCCACPWWWWWLIWRQNIHPNRECPSSKYGHATHLLEAENAISSHLVSILSDSAFDGGGVTQRLDIGVAVSLTLDTIGAVTRCLDIRGAISLSLHDSAAMQRWTNEKPLCGHHVCSSLECALNAYTLLPVS